MLPVVSVEGRVVADPELRFAPTGTAVGSLRVVASNRKQVDGEWVDDKTLWLQVTCFKQLAENVADSLRRGDLVVVTGRLQTEEWENQEGQKRSRDVLIADDIGISLKFRSVPHSSGRAERSSTTSSSAPAEDPWSTAPASGASSEPVSEEPPF